MRLARFLFPFDLLVGAAGLSLVVLSLVLTSGASGATPVSDGSDWGARGLLDSDSSQTARWDNTENATNSSVPRSAAQVIPHTAGKTYADVSAADQQAYASHFGKDNGLGGLSVSVSQTTDLVAQAVTVSLSGAKPDLPGGGADSNTYFQVFQCWGAPGADGQPDPAATSPDPETCEFGATGADTRGGSAQKVEYRRVAGDPLVAGGDWAKYNVSFPPVEVPFLSIGGAESGSNLDNANTFFDHTTTNEFSHITVPASGATSRQFDLQTGSESAGLGCGQRSDAPSTPTCWLVVVPRIAGFDDNLGATAPTVWAQRMQFKLSFQPTASFCASGGSRSLLAGSEMLSRAAASWIPGVCTTKSVALSYTKLGDQVARGQYQSRFGADQSDGGGDPSALLTSDPVSASAASIPVPLALTAPVIAFNYDYHPACTGNLDITTVTTEAQASQCGYDSLSELVTDRARAGQPVRDLHLDATLVAKLLTMSYTASMIQSHDVTLPDWTRERPATLTADPEFRALNPQLHLAPDQSDIASMVLEGGASDAATNVWRWIQADPAAASFLSGCPDAYGVVVNPFFSSRTYSGCADTAGDLANASLQARQATDSPADFVDGPVTYPPTTIPYPLPQWQQQAPVRTAGGELIQTARTLVDKQPRVNDMSFAARDAFIGYKPTNGTFCTTVSEPLACTPAPGKWKDDKLPQHYGNREIFSITDTPSASRYQLATASLCSDDGAHCVAANTGSLQAAADTFTPSAVPGYQQPALAPDYAGGAYPLTLPVYGAVSPALSQADRKAYADAFDYITTTGQVPGYAQGDLPPGYAPLTPALTTAAATAISGLRAAVAIVPVVKPVSSPSTKKSKQDLSFSAAATPTPAITSSASATDTTSLDGSGGGGDGSLNGGGKKPAPASSDVAAPSSSIPTTEVQTMPVAASTETWPGWLLPLGVGLALGAGMAGPFLRRKSTVRLR